MPCHAWHGDWRFLYCLSQLSPSTMEAWQKQRYQWHQLSLSHVQSPHALRPKAAHGPTFILFIWFNIPCRRCHWLVSPVFFAHPPLLPETLPKLPLFPSDVLKHILRFLKKIAHSYWFCAYNRLITMTNLKPNQIKPKILSLYCLFALKK